MDVGQPASDNMHRENAQRGLPRAQTAMGGWYQGKKQIEARHAIGIDYQAQLNWVTTGLKAGREFGAHRTAEWTREEKLVVIGLFSNDSLHRTGEQEGRGV